MFFFNETTANNLNVLLNNDYSFKLIILWGERGNGKTFTIHSVLENNHIKTKEIIFSEENMFPFNIVESLSTPINDEDTVLIQYSQLLKEDYCLIFQNMEFCDMDSQRLLYRLIKYHKNNDQKACIVLEYNTLQEPDDILCSLAKPNNIICIANPNKNSFYGYYTMCFDDTPKAKILFEKILQITHGNILDFFTTLNIMQYMDILHDTDKGLAYNNTAYKIPSSLLDLYIDLFDSLKEYAREPLISAAPFSKQIYSTIIQGIYYNYDNFEEYLHFLCEKGCFILKNNADNNKDLQLFQSHYIFADEYARKAVIARLEPEKVEKIISRYYGHLDSLYNNKHIYNNLKESDKILLLSKLTKRRQDRIKINQIDYITELMEYYYKRFMYLNVIKQADTLLESRIVNNQQLNNISHKFWVVFFDALLAVGEYERILGYKEQFSAEDLNYRIAVALYNYGQPADALKLLENELSGTKEYKGDVYNLAASIYDWLGNNKKSTDLFKKAFIYCNNDRLKYQLYKKYSMYIDFRIPECREKMYSAMEFYKTRNLKQYAECLHNYGTGCVMIQNYDEAEKNLELSIKMLSKICSNEIYHPLNSLAILYCYKGERYKAAINVLKKALKCDIDVSFCELAVHNNLFNIGIHIEDMDFVKAEKNILELLLKKECSDLRSISKDRPDIQHQLRQFYYNCALLSILENNDEEALSYFIKAKECSTYHSVILYSVEKNIIDLKTKLGKNGFMAKFREKKIPAPTELEKYIYNNKSYLCEIMFWG